MLKELFDQRPLPSILTMDDGSACDTVEKWAIRRKEILDLFSKEVFGILPPAPKKEDVIFTLKFQDSGAINGQATYSRVGVCVMTPKGPYCFDFDLYVPNIQKKAPCIVMLQFSLHCIYSTFPIEQIIENGFATAMVYNGDIMQDRNDFAQGLGSGFIRKSAEFDNLAADTYAANYLRGEEQSGMIGIWAYGAMRIMDYLYTLDTIDRRRIAIAGHSRLGKTALWTAANDERYTLAFISGSGNTGASLSKYKTDKNEHIGQITEIFPHWFAKSYLKYAGQEEHMPFDQHMLLAALAPRAFYVCSGSEDTWAGPDTEYLCCVAAQPAYELLGEKGFIHPDRLPQAGDVFGEGSCGYSMHKGGHFLGRFEWQNVMDFMKKM